MARIRNIDPTGGSRQFLDGRVVGHGETVEVTDDEATELIKQSAVWEREKPAKTKEGER